MPEMHGVVVKVISQNGRCSVGHKVGDEWVISGKTPEGICLSAFNILSYDLHILMYGGAYPWEKDPDTITTTCPDSANPVVFELKRVR